MSVRAKDISYRIKSFSDEVIAFVMNLSDEEWARVCDAEKWAVGVTARHIGGHLGIVDMISNIVRGEELPQMSMDDITDMANQDARVHADCTKAEVVGVLLKNSAEMVAFVVGLSDDDLDRKGSMPAFGGEVTTEQMIEFVIFTSAAQHFDSLMATVGK